TNGARGGAVWAWGRNDVGQLGNGTTSLSVPTPKPVVGAVSIKAMSAGKAWAMARTTDDEALVWGTNDAGQQGIGVISGTQLFPARTGPWMGRLAAIAAGFSHALAIGKDAKLWGWGRNCEFELAQGSTCDYRVTVERIPSFAAAAMVSGGGSHTL